MLNKKSVAVVVSAYNEETQIADVIKTMPKWVDRIVVVNDASQDKTAEVVKSLFSSEFNKSDSGPFLSRSEVLTSTAKKADLVVLEVFKEEAELLVPYKIESPNPATDRIVLLTHLRNGGKGAAVATGYAYCRDYMFDCVVTIDGDGQMDLDELEAICMPVVSGEVDFVKGNRLSHRSASKVIPTVRLIGNSILSILTKIASGYWSISDSQTGYTSTSKEALEKIKLHKIYLRYGMPNDILVKMNIAGCRVKEIPIRPVYGVGEVSKMRISKVIPTVSLLLTKSFFKRLWLKYFIKSFHPLFILYHLGFVFLFAAFVLGIYIAWQLFVFGPRPALGYYFMFVTLVVLAFQSILFAMWMDIQDNERLMKY
jgi:glycosyltransferase involved in cell wall biosynthesis